MSQRTNRLSAISNVKINTRFTDHMISTGTLLKQSRFSIKINDPVIRTQLLERRSPQRSIWQTRRMLRQAIYNKTSVVIRYRKQPDRSGNSEVKNYIIDPLEIKIVKTKSGKRVVGVYAYKEGTKELRLFLIKDIVMCRNMSDRPVKTARDRVLERS